METKNLNELSSQNQVRIAIFAAHPTHDIE